MNPSTFVSTATSVVEGNTEETHNTVEVARYSSTFHCPSSMAMEFAWATLVLSPLCQAGEDES